MSNSMHILAAMFPVQKGPVGQAAAPAAGAAGAGVALDGPLAFETQLAAQGSDAATGTAGDLIAPAAAPALLAAGVSPNAILVPLPTPSTAPTQAETLSKALPSNAAAAAQLAPGAAADLSVADLRPALTTDLPAQRRPDGTPALGPNTGRATSTAANSHTLESHGLNADPQLDAFARRATAELAEPVKPSTPLAPTPQPASPSSSSAPATSAALGTAQAQATVPKVTAEASHGVEPGPQGAPRQAANGQPSNSHIAHADLGKNGEAPVRLDVRIVPEIKPTPAPQSQALNQASSATTQGLTTAANAVAGTPAATRVYGLQSRVGNANTISPGGHGATGGVHLATASLPITEIPIVAGETIGLGGQGPNLDTGTGAGTLDSAAAMAARAGLAPTGNPAHAGQAPVEQVAVQIAAAARAGIRQISIQLRPAALGEINVELQVSHDGNVRAVVLAERQETLDLLQRDARGLERALQDAGLKSDSGSLSFGLRGQGHQAGGGQQHASTAYTQASGLDESEMPAASAYAATGLGDHSVDIHV